MLWAFVHVQFCISCLKIDKNVPRATETGGAGGGKLPRASNSKGPPKLEGFSMGWFWPYEMIPDIINKAPEKVSPWAPLNLSAALNVPQNVCRSADFNAHLNSTIDLWKEKFLGWTLNVKAINRDSILHVIPWLILVLNQFERLTGTHVLSSLQPRITNRIIQKKRMALICFYCNF